MSKFGRRLFLKLMGQSAAILSVGLSRRSAFAEKVQTKQTAAVKRTKRITVEEHMSFPGSVGQMAIHKDTSGVTMKMPWEVPGQMPHDYKGQTMNSPMGSVDKIDQRLQDMDDAGIDLQVLSAGSVEEYENLQDAINLAKKTNDNLAEVVNKYPKRFAAYCTLPWQDSAAAITELERAVKELGLRGIKIDGTVKGEYLDNKKFWPVFKKAEELGTPIFIHPEEMQGDKLKPYLDYPGLSGAGWGYAMDTGTQAVRLIASGLFDECPNLMIILGHMGEGLPYWSWRLNHHGPGQLLKKWPAEYIKSNFYISTSGHFDHPALICSWMAVGADHLLFGVDFPTDSNKQAVEFMETAPYLSQSDKEKIYHLNAERIFKF
jgi:predicted TIM-barrel fold metal-dependent hydrolase